MRRARFALSLLLTLAALPNFAEPETIRIHAGKLLDGRGGARENVTVTIAGSRIVSVEPGSQTRSPAWRRT